MSIITSEQIQDVLRYGMEKTIFNLKTVIQN